jgi:small nuclear ribonucleoprotein (snRNP)-like protein
MLIALLFGFFYCLFIPQYQSLDSSHSISLIRTTVVYPPQTITTTETSLAATMSESPHAEESGPIAGSPSDFLKNIVGKRVKVRIGSGVDYHGTLLGGVPACNIPCCPLDSASRLFVISGRIGRGVQDRPLRRFILRPPAKNRIADPTPGLLVCLDGYMNVALEETEEWSGGRLTSTFGDCFLRGNNGRSYLRMVSNDELNHSQSYTSLL